MKKALFVGIATLLGLGACDSDSGGAGTDDGTSGTTSAETTATAGETLTATNPSATTESATSSTTSAESSSTSGSTTTASTDTDTGDESSSSSTGGGSGITPCQPKMSRADIERWTADVDNRMPTLAGIIMPLTDMSSQAAAAGGFADLPDPQAGGSDFIEDPDGGGVSVECSVWDQDCDDGEKCAAWANDGGSSWNAARCVPVDADPVGPGETCTVEGSGTSGIDNCDAESMCWAVDTETNEGTCVALCEGSPGAPTCAPEATACSIANNGVLILCLPICNPIADECGEGQGCFPVGEFFQCAPVAGGGEPGDPCEFLNACDDGSACVNPTQVPGCDGNGCCSSYCDLTAEDPGCLAGQECLPWYEMGQEPDACLEGIGFCGTPA